MDYGKVWEPVMREFEENCPHIASKAIDWYPVSQNHICVRTNDGDRYIYGFIGASLVKVHDPAESCSMDDEKAWRKEFAKRLQYKMQINNMPRWKLSEITGISEVTISKYANGKVTPSMYNAERLAKALKCSVLEFINSGVV